LGKLTDVLEEESPELNLVPGLFGRTNVIKLVKTFINTTI